MFRIVCNWRAELRYITADSCIDTFFRGFFLKTLLPRNPFSKRLLHFRALSKAVACVTVQQGDPACWVPWFQCRKAENFVVKQTFPNIFHSFLLISVEVKVGATFSQHFPLSSLRVLRFASSCCSRPRFRWAMVSSSK